MSGRRDSLIQFGSGNASPREINAAIESAWSKLLNDPKQLKEAADALGVEPVDLKGRLKKPPFVVEPDEAGMGVVETAMLLFAAELGRDILKDLLKDAAESSIKAGLRRLWKVLKRPVEEELPIGSIGDEKDGEDQ